MNQIPQELLDSLEVIFAIYSAVSVLAVAYALFNYVATGVSLFRMMDKTGVSNPWMAWVPFCSSYALGALADNYNLLWEAKPTSYAKKVLGWHIAVTALAQPLVLSLYAMSPDSPIPTDLWLLLLGYAAAGWSTSCSTAFPCTSSTAPSPPKVPWDSWFCPFWWGSRCP